MPSHPSQFSSVFKARIINRVAHIQTIHLHLMLRSTDKWSYNFIPPIRLHGMGDFDQQHNICTSPEYPHTVSGKVGHISVYPKVSRLPAWSENCKWYSSLPLSAV
jgi:hypothetical protein